MRENTDYRALTPEEISALEATGCSAENWATVMVAPQFTPRYIKNATFSGNIRLGHSDGEFELPGGLRVHAGISDVRLHDCTVGNGVYINRIANYIANYDIADGAFIENVDSLICTLDSSFGVATRVSVLNETGGREVPVYPELSAQLAYIIAMYRHDRALTERLCDLIDGEASLMVGRRGKVGNGAKAVNCGSIENVMIGDHAVLNGVTRLRQGSIAGSESDSVHVGANVIAENFIFCSGAEVEDGAVVMNSFVGQACRLNHLFSAHDSLFFANCVCENGEAAAIFAGPYTVTMHKSSLLIAGMYSFLNAGSGSNQSNHMYKLGPVHQGVVSRGSKTTSDSYILWPARIGAFSLVMGRHVNHPDTSELPFSYLIEKYGRSFLVPGVNLKSVGTIRDARKWPQRDKRRGEKLLDRINFNLLSPFTAQKMMAGIKVLNDIEQTGGVTADTYTYRGMTIEPRALAKGKEYYAMALDKFMGNSLIHRLRNVSKPDSKCIAEAFRPTTEAGRGPWIDLAGMFAPEAEIKRLCSDIVARRIATLPEIENRLNRLADDYYEMEWTWVVEHFKEWFGKEVDELTVDDILSIASRWHRSVIRLDNLLYDDARKDFSRISQIGFGVNGSAEMADEDFRAVRGEFDNDPFVCMVRDHIDTKTALFRNLTERLTTDAK